MYLDRFSFTEQYRPRRVYVFHACCANCGANIDVILPAEGLFKFRQGASVQDAFPHLSPSEREMLITGIGECCWGKLLGEAQ
jgi:hypothetical protein